MMGSAYIFFIETKNNFLIMNHGVAIESVITNEYECRTGAKGKLHICVEYWFELPNKDSIGSIKYTGKAHLWETKLGEHPPGSKLIIFYYPEDPNISDTFFEDGQHLARYYAGNVFSFILFLIGLIFLAAAGKSYKIGKNYDL